MKQRIAMLALAWIAGVLGACGGTAKLEPGAPPALQQVIVQPSSADAPAGSSLQYCARGVYGNDPGPPREISGTVDWSSADPAVATVSPTTGGCTSANAIAPGAASIQASSVSEDGRTVSGTGTINVTPPPPNAMTGVVPATATVVAGKSQQFIGCATFGMSSDADVCSAAAGGPGGRPAANNLLNWSSATPAVATVNASGVATGIGASATPTPVTATFANGVGDPPPAKRSASALLTVIPPGICAKQLLVGDGATWDTAKGSACLACSVDNPGFIVDGNPLSYARMNASLSALDALGVGFVSVTIHAASGISFGAGQPAGFVIGRPAADLLSAEVLAQTTVATLLGNTVQETASPSDGADSLVLEALGSEILPPPASDPEKLYALFIKITAKPFDALRLTFSPAVASVLSVVNVFQACPAMNLPAP